MGGTIHTPSIPSTAHRLLYRSLMDRSWIVTLVLAAALLPVGCTGGSETSAAEEDQPTAESGAPESSEASVDARAALERISPAIPVYQGAQFHGDLTRRDEAMVRSRYGDDARVYTLATDDSFPQVFHYYTTYLAQFRSFPAQETYPSPKRSWRTLEVRLNDAMQDPFIPGRELAPGGKQVLLQIAETEAEPKTVIRYIVMPPAPAAPAAPAVASADPAREASATR